MKISEKLSFWKLNKQLEKKIVVVTKSVERDQMWRHNEIMILAIVSQSDMEPLNEKFHDFRKRTKQNLSRSWKKLSFQLLKLILNFICW